MALKLRYGGAITPCKWCSRGGIYIWGRRHERYIREHHKIYYLNLLTSGTLVAYLANIDRKATEMYDRLVEQIAERESVTEQLKSDNLLLWVQRMNNIRNRATEFVLS